MSRFSVLAALGLALAISGCSDSGSEAARLERRIEELSRELRQARAETQRGNERVIAALCDELAILEQGRLVDTGPTRTILQSPRHPYTQKLLGSVPRMPA